MQFDMYIVIIIAQGIKHVQFSLSVAIYMMVLKICTGKYFMKTSRILITVKESNYSGLK